VRLIYRAEAAADVAAARYWYEEQRTSLKLEFEQALDEVGRLRCEMPEAFPLVHRDLRRALLRRFPYALYYRFLEADILEVIACLHTRRAPGAWKDRESGITRRCT